MIGESIMSYVKRLKIQRAAYALIHSDKSVTDIAFEAGYESLEGFIRAFQKQYQYSPRQYREHARSDKYCPPMIMTNKIREMNMYVEIKKLPEMKIAFVRHVGPYAECRAAWRTLLEWARPRGLLGPETKYLGVCHDDPEVTEQSKIRYDASILVNKDVQESGGIGVKTVAPGTYAMAVHKGSYETLHDTYAYICGAWAVENVVELESLPVIEMYLNDLDNTPKEELITEIYVPIISR